MSKLLPYGLGGVALLAVALFVVNMFFGELLKNLAGRTPDAVLRLVRRQRRVGGGQLRRYRARTVDRHRRHQLGLIEDDSVDIRQIYVPLRCAATGEELAPTVREASRCVVLGAPGAGKSLLLKSAILDWASEEEDEQGIPVLLDLHRCNSSEATFEAMVTEQLEWGQVRNAETYARNALEGGRLRVFFDGLDEVTSSEQPGVVQRLKGFASRYPDCPMTVTCRTAAWTGQLAPDFPLVLRVAEFDDPSVRLFLRRWDALGPASRLTGVEQVLAALRATPELMRLARSPLMLTIIAWLQSETRAEDVGPLPTSRAAFYKLAIEHLLDRDRLLNRGVALGRYRAQRKLIALQRIALALQETYATRSDRLVIDRTALDAVLTEVLPNVNLSESDRDPFFEEIVQRSQLMTAVDSIGNHFSFPHLTLQEFLAAQALHNRPERLMRNYRADPGAWRETVKMWCAVASVDCTDVVRELWEDPGPEGLELALACLGDVAYVDAALADGIVERCLVDFRSASPDVGPVHAGLAALAASTGPRGERVRGDLTAMLVPSASPPGLRLRAALTLAASGRPGAASVLAQLAEDHRAGRPEGAASAGVAEDHVAGLALYVRSLRAMGEIAIPAVGRSAGPGDQAWAVDLLAELADGGAREAVEPLVAALAYEHGAARRAAWQLASLVDTPELAATIGSLPVPRWPDHDNDSLDWIWAPFVDDTASSLPRVVARIVLSMGVDPEPRFWTGERLPYPGANALLRAAEDIEHVSPRIAIPVIGIDRRRADGGSEAGMALGEVWDARRQSLSELVRPGGVPRPWSLAAGRLTEIDNFLRLRDAMLTVHHSPRPDVAPLLLKRFPAHVQAGVLTEFYYGNSENLRNDFAGAWAAANRPEEAGPGGPSARPGTRRRLRRRTAAGDNPLRRFLDAVADSP